MEISDVLSKEPEACAPPPSEPVVKPEPEVKQEKQDIKTESPVATPAISLTEQKPATGSGINLVETIGGSQTRRYLNDKVTPVLLEGMRKIAVEQPADPLRVLGEYLIERSDN
ncbi:uncharacterized protein GVI51_K06369 [Nakaseomyces glabratus]|uniref:COMPASS component SDC1 n=1 Tax=Candida glabrata (strain ATCC 2001 / BCRC 20586 / JCM 3761 / NBRC 0622 / NRRL Y-65 / CBS 138) TaxID=284593 RepID=Q6FMN7_CANGA|nr:uncharacterized protein CAGL0K06523g [Nakaseomyces glabratus]KAH7597069.1 Dpy-30 motif [Nakaseomyces glabratus]KAH7602841.1 Dpy-30 motif [Nakaseomyces glabratus]QHS68167.1 uncharacterized protein GVI51_K06369 [Nakaseomyces glabratus]UCS22311.1 uncharacterized protein GW608_K06347 [Nakaseomyces glabratus]UCS27543.1 uncharacterized protein HLK63_K06347 [Nakaseomyces glabratus]|eukprot:XP_448507.1 uncharacterized protein CAGL0K06523g [[Candida] glabrata]